MPILLLIIPVLSTLTGGLLAVRFRRSLTLLIAVGAGLLLGAAFLDLLPEAIEIGGAGNISAATVLTYTLVSYLVFLALGSALDALALRVETAHSPGRWLRKSWLGKVGGSLLIFHSFRDGMAIGLAYAASHPAGYAVAVGIAAHDLGDGMNTIILTTSGQRPRPIDYFFLVLDSLAPLAGGLLTAWWTFSSRSSVILLALAAGFFLQMATSDFLPEVRRREGPRLDILLAVLCGSGIIYTANLLLQHLH